MAHELTGNDVVVLKDKGAWWQGMPDTIGRDLIISESLTARQVYDRYWRQGDVESWHLTAQTAETAALLDRIALALESGDTAGANSLFERYRDSLVEVDSHRANIRVATEDNGDTRSHCVGVVGENYQICTDLELAEFADACVGDSNTLTIETAGTIRDGARVWFLARGDAWDAGGGDRMVDYMLFSNGHDKSSLRCTPTTTRAVCANTLHASIPRDDYGQAHMSAIVIRHTGNLREKMEQAASVMRNYRATMENFRRDVEKLRSTPVTRAKATELFSKQYTAYWEVADKVDLASKDDAVRKLAERRVERMNTAHELFMERFESEADQFGGNLWIAANAFTGYLQNDRTKSETEAQQRRKLESQFFGSNAVKSRETFDLALGMAS